jgi:hypothetical protein
MDPTSGVDWVSVDVPAAGTLVAVEDLPQSCKDKLISDNCGPIPGDWATLMCVDLGQLYCCAPEEP